MLKKFTTRFHPPTAVCFGGRSLPKMRYCLVLTGGDGEGSFGVQIIKERGGQVIAQDRLTSQDFSMWETSINPGGVDFIRPLNQIAPNLIELAGVNTPYRLDGFSRYIPLAWVKSKSHMLDY